MDPATLAASVAALVAPYLRKAGEEFVGEAGQYVQKKAGELWGKLRAKFDSDPRTRPSSTHSRPILKPEARNSRARSKRRPRQTSPGRTGLPRK